MTFLARILGFGGIWIYLAIAAAIFAAGGLSGAKVQRVLDAPTIAQGKTDLAASRLETSQARNALLDQQKATALDLARANATALTQRNALEATVASLSTKATQAEKARQAASTKLLDTLKAIPHDQQTTLPASSRNYLRGVRDAQAAAGSAPSDH